MDGLAFVPWNSGKGKTILATEEAGIIKVSNAEWRHHVVEMSHPIVIDLYKVEDESRSFLGRIVWPILHPRKKIFFACAKVIF